MGGSAATGNVNGKNNLGSQGGSGTGGTGVDNTYSGRHLLAYNKQVCHPHVLMQAWYLLVPLWGDSYK